MIGKVTMREYIISLLKVVFVVALLPAILWGVPYLTGIDGGDFALFVSAAASVCLILVWAYFMALSKYYDDKAEK